MGRQTDRHPDRETKRQADTQTHTHTTLTGEDAVQVGLELLVRIVTELLAYFGVFVHVFGEPLNEYAAHLEQKETGERDRYRQTDRQRDGQREKASVNGDILKSSHTHSHIAHARV